MMMIALSTLTIDPFGHQVIHLDAGRAGFGDTARRVSRIATLDGGAAILDGGYTVADRTITLDLTGQDKTLIDDLKYLTEMYSKLLVFTPDGAFTATPERLSEQGGTVRMTLLVSGIAELKP